MTDEMTDERMTTKPYVPRAFASIDHHKSDPYTHNYCLSCAEQIPSMLKRSVFIINQRPAEAEWENPVYCEGCGVEIWVPDA